MDAVFAAKDAAMSAVVIARGQLQQPTGLPSHRGPDAPKTSAQGKHACEAEGFRSWLRFAFAPSGYSAGGATVGANQVPCEPRSCELGSP